MRSIQLSQLKAESFCLQTLIESVVEIRDLDDGYRNIRELLKDLDGLKEALFFKYEKIKHKLKSVQEKVDFNKIDFLCSAIDGVKLKTLGESQDILERNKDINELKLLQRVIRYSIEVDKQNFCVLDALLNSENIEDWRFFAIFLSLTIEHTESENLEILVNYSKSIENKMIKVFQDACAENNKIMMRAAYCTLLELNKEYSIIQIYIYSLDLFNKPLEILESKVRIIDLDFYDNENSSFTNLISEIRDAYEKEFSHLANVFPNPEKIFSSINKKVFEGLIYFGLEKFLKNNNVGEYLLNLAKCYTDVKVLCSYIESLDNTFVADDIIDELFGHYMNLAVTKEKDLFGEIFNSMVIGGAIQNIKYIVNGEEVRFSKNYYKVYLNLLSVIHSSLERARIFYPKNIEVELIEHFFLKIHDFLDIINASVKEKVEVIKLCSFIFLTTRRYLKDKFDLLHSFKVKLNELIQTSYDYKVTEGELRLKQKISVIYFMDPEEYKSIIFAIDKELNEFVDVRGKNVDVFLDKLLNFVYTRIYKQMLTVVYNPDQIKNMQRCIRELCIYVNKLGRVDASQKYSYLQDVSNVISVDKNDFTLLYGTLIGKIEEKELIKIIKCRKDRDVILKKLYLNN